MNRQINRYYITINSKNDLSQKASYMNIPSVSLVWCTHSFCESIWGNINNLQNIFGLVGRHNQYIYDVFGFDSGQAKIYFTRYNTNTDTFSYTGYINTVLM